MANTSTDAVNIERRRIIKNLHDGLSQQLTAASMLSHMIVGLMAREKNSCAAEVAQLNNYLQNAVEDLNALYKTLEPDLQQARLTAEHCAVAQLP